MNSVKIAAALHALADAFLDGADSTEPPPKKARGRAAQAPAPEPEPEPEQAPEIAPEPEQPPAPTVTLKQLNDLVLKVAAKHRDIAVGVLNSFGLTSTVGLAQDKWQAVYDAFEEAQAKIDADAAKVSQASLV